MKLKDVPVGAALIVKVTALSEVKQDHEVLLGIRGWIDKNLRFVPYSEKLQLFRSDLNECIGDTGVILKQDKTDL